MQTPSQTIGPFFGHALPWPDGPHVVAPDDPAGWWLRGRVHDGAGEPVPDALLETWQVGPPGCRGFGRCPTDPQGRYAIRTVKPPAPPAVAGEPAQAPHLQVAVFARGLLHRLITRVYFPDEAAANAADPVLAGLAEPLAATLLARQTEDGYAFDIRLQGDGGTDDHETVFFDL